ncbi:histidinol-phosphate transaminase [Pseudofrankia sp. BMG5.37]|uniref:histidinol-phosphate transaminase n=2 Tax=unclassified Pseudofrankia TaxID=2994372 RepID=UPI0008D9B7B2|nr:MULTISPECIES: histidinol-phosphate transaminase [unclassified Pseudofrankia]MDT3438160.1 histidinol-phosphate transaminase [Pseudofrankia sp. BMG5.37]OHV56900.1 histidinol-phosphate transaminase [Pseudofrankia sp. BMG5.36]
MTSARPWRPVTLDDLPLRHDLRGRSPYGAPQLDVAVRLNTNENPHRPSAELVDALGKAATLAATEANRYPEREAEALRADLAYYLTPDAGFGVHTSQVWAANGSNEVLQQLLQAFGGPGRRALGFEPSYSMHRLISLATATEWVAEDRADDYTLDPVAAADAVRRHQPSVVFLCSPNNPSATALPLDVVKAVCAAAEEIGGCMVIVDEAYAEFRRAGVPSALTLLPEQPKLVVTRTMSKAFALAGARVGYLAAHPAVVDALQLVRLPYHLSSFTQAVARTALAHADELLGTVEAVKAQRDRIVDELPAFGVRVVPSDANFVLFGLFRDQHAVWQCLLDHGVLVRDLSLPGWLRVTAGLPSEIDAFIGALRSVLADSPSALETDRRPAGRARTGGGLDGQGPTQDA